MSKSKLLFTLSLSLLFVAGTAIFRSVKLTLMIAMAEDQVEIFDSMRLKALAATPHEAAECLEYVQNYYPSGTRQSVNSRLDHIVERARAASEREIIAHLRIKTGKDLGSDAAKWKATLSLK